MATKNLVPRATGEGQIGLSSKKWSQANFVSGSFDTLTVGGQSITGTLTVGGQSITGTIAGLSDTDITNPASGQILVYDGTDSFDNVSLSGHATINSDGVLTISNEVVTNAMLAGSIENSKLSNSSFTINSNSLSLGGSLTLDTDDISEGSSNLYYTSARFDTQLGTKTTNNLAEGSNLYYTDERVDDRVNSLLTAGTNISLSYDDNANTLTINSTASGADNISEGQAKVETIDLGAAENNDAKIEFWVDPDSDGVSEKVWEIDTDGHLVPQAETYNIGTADKQLGNIFLKNHKIHYEVDSNLYNTATVNDDTDFGSLVIEGKILNSSSVQTDNVVLTLKCASVLSGSTPINQGAAILNLLSGNNLNQGNYNGLIRFGSHVDSSNGYYHSTIWDSKSDQNGNDWENWYSGLNFSVNSTLPYKNISGVQDRDHVTFTIQTDKAIFWHPLELRYWDTNTASHMKFYDSNNSNYTSLTQQSTITSDRTLTLPDESGTLATQTYVQNYVQGLDVKESVRVATTAGGTLSSSFENGDTIDDVVLVTGDRILIKNQSTASQNGIYVVNASGAPTRASDLAAGAGAAGIFTFVEEGTTNGDKGFVCTSNSGSDVVGTNDLSFTTFSSAGSGLTDIVNDTTPQLGGPLDVNGQDIISVSNGNITLTPNGTGVVRIDGTNGIDVQSGEISVKNSGSVSNIKLYCESANAHYTQIQSAAHASYSGNVTLTLPVNTGTLISTGDTGTVTNTMLAGLIEDSKLNTITTADKISLSALDLDGGTDIGADLVDADLIIVDDGAGGTNRKSELTRMKKYIYSAISGDATATDAGDLTIASGAIETAMVNANVIAGQTAETTIADDDEILIYDTSESALRKMTKANFVTGLGGGGSKPDVTSDSPSSNYTITTYTGIEEVFLLTPSTDIDVILPAAATATKGYKYQIKNLSTNTITIKPASTETIDGVTAANGGFVMSAQYASASIITDGSNWFII